VASLKSEIRFEVSTYNLCNFRHQPGAMESGPLSAYPFLEWEIARARRLSPLDWRSVYLGQIAGVELPNSCELIILPPAGHGGFCTA